MIAQAESLRPLGLGQLLDRAIRLYRRNFLTFTGIIALVLVPVTLIQLIVTVVNIPNSIEATERLQTFTESSNPMRTYLESMAALSGGGLAFVVSVLNIVLVQGLGMAALARAVGNSYLGEEVEIGSSFSKSIRVWGRVLLAMLLFFLLLIGLGVLAIIPCVGWIFGLGILIYAGAVINQMYIPIVVLEGKRPGEAIRRAWELARRRFWWVLGFMVVLSIFSQLVISGPATLINVITAAITSTALPADDMVTQLTIQNVVQTLVSLFLLLVYYPLQVTAVILMYLDLRVRTEGFDLSVAVASTEGEAQPDVETLMEQTPPGERGGIVTGTEFLYFGGVALAVGGLYAGLVAILFFIFGLIGAAAAF